MAGEFVVPPVGSELPGASMSPKELLTVGLKNFIKYQERVVLGMVQLAREWVNEFLLIDCTQLFREPQ